MAAEENRNKEPTKIETECDTCTVAGEFAKALNLCSRSLQKQGKPDDTACKAVLDEFQDAKIGIKEAFEKIDTLTKTPDESMELKQIIDGMKSKPGTNKVLSDF